MAAVSRLSPGMTTTTSMMIRINSTKNTTKNTSTNEIRLPSSSSSSKATSCNLKSNVNRRPLPQPQPQPQPRPFLRKETVASVTFAPEVTILEQLERLFLFGEAADDRSIFNNNMTKLSGPSTPSHNTIGFSGGGRPVRVAYQGVRGSYCQEAALKAFSTMSNIESFAACNTMEDAFQALEDKSAQRAIVPLENSIDGTIDRNLDLLLRHDDVAIVGELILPVNHCLLAVPGTSMLQLKRIVSHPQALSHCKSKLECLGLEVDEVPNSADAARYVSENRLTDTAVIGSRMAAKEFNLRILEENMQDDSNGNFNRFLQLGLKDGGCSCSGGGGGGGGGGRRKKNKNKNKNKKTTIAFSLEKGISDLFKAMEIFDNENISVTRVEQRPNRSNPVKMMVVDDNENSRNHHHRHHHQQQCRYYFDYVFILDLEFEEGENGNNNNNKLSSTLWRLKEISNFVRVLGSYTSCEGIISSSSS